MKMCLKHAVAAAAAVMVGSATAVAVWVVPGNDLTALLNTESTQVASVQATPAMPTPNSHPTWESIFLSNR